MPDGVLASRTERRFGWPIPTKGRRRNDLNLIALLFWVGAGAIAIGFVALGLISIALTAHDGLSQLFDPVS